MKDLHKFLIIILLTFILNAFWEILHYRLYFDLSGIPKYPHLLLATFTDMAIITLIFLMVSFRNRNINWINNPRKFDYFIIIILGLLVAIFIEIRALSIGRWAYKQLMPTIFGIGVSPLLQLSLTAVSSLLLVNLNKSRH